MIAYLLRAITEIQLQVELLFGISNFAICYLISEKKSREWDLNPLI